MNDAIRHRGPDETGFLSGDYCTLAMSRLSIIDLKGGQQPIYNEDRSKCVFFNGEIYNFREIRSELRKMGHQFATQSDTEVLIHLYEQFGESMLDMLRGMFALCIYDITKETLFLARDRFGEKPLFYHFDGQVFTFSSEIKSLLQNPQVPRVFNDEVLHYYLCVSFVPEPSTLFKNVFSLEPGHSLTFKNGVIRVKPYFCPDYKQNEDIKTEAEAREFLRPILQKAVTRQTVADVPLGAFLSGGLDSTTIAAFVQKNSDRRLKTFTVRFEDASFDESPIARQVANLLGTDHQEITVPNSDFDEDIFWTIIDHVGFPFADSSAIPTYYITREIRNHVTVALSGDGGDELFGGYPVFQWWQRIKGVQNYPNVVRESALRVTNFLATVPSMRMNNGLRQVSRALTVARHDEREFGLGIHTMYNKGELNTLFGNRSSSVELTYEQLCQFPKRAEHWSSLRKSMFYRLKYNLPLDMLTKVDRMSMANSLEVRAPFLDADLFAAASQIPDRMLIKNGQGKHILRRLMQEDLPKSVFDRPKTGFSIPLHHYQNRQFEGLAHAKCTNEILRSR
jgi:asparagine synthase (glutamine-hydrolysing)